MKDKIAAARLAIDDAAQASILAFRDSDAAIMHAEQATGIVTSDRLGIERCLEIEEAFKAADAARTRVELALQRWARAERKHLRISIKLRMQAREQGRA